jgi:hypothetical protein
VDVVPSIGIIRVVVGLLSPMSGNGIHDREQWRSLSWKVKLQDLQRGEAEEAGVRQRCRVI